MVCKRVDVVVTLHRATTAGTNSRSCVKLSSCRTNCRFSIP